MVNNVRKWDSNNLWNQFIIKKKRTNVNVWRKMGIRLSINDIFIYSGTHFRKMKKTISMKNVKNFDREENYNTPYKFCFKLVTKNGIHWFSIQNENNAKMFQESINWRLKAIEILRDRKIIPEL